ncbi:MAG: hypothetical protein NTW16_16970 [Bacteroidetes bacterium]|nr:hypothetical protein [Bacteroidota bacterium]
MNTSDFSEQPEKKQRIDYFVHLVRIAMADDSVSVPELELLRRIGKTQGFTDAETENLILTTGKSDYIPPVGLAERFEQIHGIIKMTLADGAIDKNEMRSATGFAIKSGFRENEIPKLLLFLIDGIKQGQDEKALFEIYNKDRKP